MYASGLTCWRLKLRVENLVGVLYQNKSCVMWYVLSHVFYSTPWILQSLWPPCNLFLKKRTLEEFESSALICTYIAKTIQSTFQHSIDKNWGYLSLLNLILSSKACIIARVTYLRKISQGLWVGIAFIFGGWLIGFCIFYSFLIDLSFKYKLFLALRKGSMFSQIESGRLILR